MTEALPGRTVRPAALAVVLALAYLALALPRLDEYGPTWDTAFGEIPHGERYLEYLLSGDERWLDFVHAPRPARREPHLDDRFDLMPWNESYPLGAILSAASCRVLWTQLGWVPSLAAHHLIVPLFAALLVFLLARFAAALSPAAAVGAAAALVLSPRFFADSIHNLKDVPESALYVAACLAFLAALTDGRWRYWLGGGVLTGLALAQKPNALFLGPHVLVLYLGCVALWWIGRAPRPVGIGRAACGALVALVALAAAHVAVSPMLWSQPWLHLVQRFAFIVGVATDPGAWEPFEGARLVAVTTPPAVLALALLGLFHPGLGAVRRWFLVLGVCVPIGRTALPSFVNFDGVRHFLEYLPFLALLAGAGVDLLVRLAVRGMSAPLPRAALAGAVVAAAFAFPALATVRTHPNGTCYFNAFIGGLAGAQARGITDATDYWANSYWQGFRLLRDLAPEGSTLIVPIAEHVARCGAPQGLPDQVALADPYQPPAQGPCFVMFITREAWYEDTVRWLLAEHEPVHDLRVQGAPILRLYRLDRPDDVARAHQLWSEGRATVRLLVQARRLCGDAVAQAAHAILLQARRLGEADAIRRLQELLPEELDADAPPAVRRALRKGMGA